MKPVATLISRRRPVGALVVEVPNVPDYFLEKVLQLYKPQVRYLQSAQVKEGAGPEGGEPGRLVAITGRFSIHENGFSEEVRHFNAVEFHLCYHQLAYVLMGQCIFRGIFNRLHPGWYGWANLSFAKYFRKQLFTLDIVHIEGSFLQPLNCYNFFADLAIEKITVQEETALLDTSISFSDAFGIKSHGHIKLAFRLRNGL
ncbi:FcoT family thioesterase [Paraflavisolibacter sp. H34]|uniref:FcoT family thioesterase n=1 Tax=Huijunlia imazamoxiresistens TaxID=3127457 RepID=UPI0030198A0A